MDLLVSPNSWGATETLNTITKFRAVFVSIEGENHDGSSLEPVSALASWRGFFWLSFFSITADIGLRICGIFPPLTQRMSDALLLLATAYRTVYAIATTSRRGWPRSAHGARTGRRRHLPVISIVGAVVTWNKDLGPYWYPLALVATAVPCAWVGGKLRLMQLTGGRSLSSMPRQSCFRRSGRGGRGAAARRGRTVRSRSRPLRIICSMESR